MEKDLKEYITPDITEMTYAIKITNGIITKITARKIEIDLIFILEVIFLANGRIA